MGHDDDERHLGVQCKNTVDGVSLTVIEAEIRAITIGVARIVCAITWRPA